MKTIAFYILVLLSAVNADEAKLGYYPSRSDDGKPNASTIDKIVSDADRTIWYDGAHNYQLKLGVSPKATFQLIRQSLVDEQKKDFIVVYFDKTVMANKTDFIETAAVQVTKDMRDVGYKRIVILGANSFGVDYIADTNSKTKKKQKSEQATPRKLSD